MGAIANYDSWTFEQVDKALQSGQPTTMNDTAAKAFKKIYDEVETYYSEDIDIAVVKVVGVKDNWVGPAADAFGKVSTTFTNYIRKSLAPLAAYEAALQASGDYLKQMQYDFGIWKNNVEEWRNNTKNKETKQITEQINKTSQEYIKALATVYQASIERLVEIAGTPDELSKQNQDDSKDKDKKDDSKDKDKDKKDGNKDKDKDKKDGNKDKKDDNSGGSGGPPDSGSGPGGPGSGSPSDSGAGAGGPGSGSPSDSGAGGVVRGRVVRRIRVRGRVVRGRVVRRIRVRGVAARRAGALAGTEWATVRLARRRTLAQVLSRPAIPPAPTRRPAIPPAPTRRPAIPPEAGRTAADRHRLRWVPRVH